MSENKGEVLVQVEHLKKYFPVKGVRSEEHTSELQSPS